LKSYQPFFHFLKYYPMLFHKKNRRMAGSINAGSMADIAFLLLIFFLVTTTILSDEGLLVKLPPFEKDPPKQKIIERNVFSVKLNANDELLVRSEPANLTFLRQRAKEFVLNPLQRPELSMSPKQAVVSIQCDRSTSYEAYLKVYNEIKAAYREMRNERAWQLHGAYFDDLPLALQREIQQAIPVIISEAEPFDALAME
jgi:biopolymer transport protein ExbD